MSQTKYSCILAFLVLSALLGCCNACTMICGNEWVGVHLHTQPGYYKHINGGLFKDQCFRYTGHHVSNEGYYWKEIQYGSDLAWVASEYTYTKPC